jgi:hypothetical protein
VTSSPADLIRPHARRLYDAGFADGQKALTAALAAVRDLTARPRHFSDAPDDEPQRWFTPADAERFADYFAADDRGHYPGHLHTYFTLPPRAFADATGLRRAFAAGRWTWAPPAGEAFADPDAAPDVLSAAAIEAMLAIAAESHAQGYDPQPALDYLAAHLRGEAPDDEADDPDTFSDAAAFASKYDESKHPRDDHGRYVAKAAIEAAHHDPAKRRF